MKIEWRVIPHSEQRYDTCGDYWCSEESLVFVTSKLSDEKYDWLLFLHEFVEYFLCWFAGVTLESIDVFDKAYEDARQRGTAPCGCQIQAEPGGDVHAPYRWQHKYADIVEQIAALALGIDWVAYGNEVESL